MEHKVIQIDTRGVAMDIAMRISREPYIRDLTTVSSFIDSEYFRICEIIAKFWQAQISNQRACTVHQVQNEISSLIDGAFCRSGVMLSNPQLQSLKTAFLEAMVSAYFARAPIGSVNWDQVELVRLNMETFTLRCTRSFANHGAISGHYVPLMHL